MSEPPAPPPLPGGEPIEPSDSLYSRSQNDNSVPWWQRNLLLNQPVLFGTWDGVFTTVMVNIFGIIVFLRMGWIVGTAGVANSVLLLFFCAALAAITVFSAIGICDRCHIRAGGVYFLISHVLGARVGATIGIVYTFGQAVATALVAVGFGESLAHAFYTQNRTTVKTIAIVTLILLTAVNAAGVSWVVRLQLFLLGCLALAVVDFLLGSLWTIDLEHGVGHFSSARLRANSEPHYASINCTVLGIQRSIPEQSIFTVFGVFFANFLGVLAGVNMSGDLRDPKKNIPVGELSALGVSTGTCFLFIMILGTVVDRSYLLCDNLISEKVSLTGWFFMIGLYVCSLSSTIGSLLGTPRVLQGIAAEGVVPILNPLAHGSGANKNPVLASAVLMAVACSFVLVGDLNRLAILSTMPFLITYAAVNYAYVSLAMTYDLEHVKHATTGDVKTYGSMHSMAESDLKELFPERSTTAATLEDGTIHEQPATWYSQFSSRYLAFAGFLINVLIIVFINFWFAVLHFGGMALLYLYISRVSTTAFPGISQFSVIHMFKTACSSLETIGIPKTNPVILGNTATVGDITTSQLNDTNPDYMERKQYHHAQDINEFD